MVLTFREWLVEKQFKHGWVKGDFTHGTMDITVFINPSSGELSKVGQDARGIVTEKGDLYMATGSGEYVGAMLLIHSDLIQYLQNVVKMGSFNTENFGSLKPTYMKIVPVQRFKNTNDIWIFESMDQDIIWSSKQVEYIRKLFKKAKKKNQSLNFYDLGVMDAYNPNTDIKPVT